MSWSLLSLLSILACSLSTLHQYSPSLEAMLVDAVSALQLPTWHNVLLVNH